MSNNLKGNLILLLTAFIWGVSFVMQDAASEVLTPFAINALRSVVGAFVLFLLSFYKSKKKKEKYFGNTKEEKHDLIKAGLICGVFLTIGINVQQFAFALYPEGMAAPGRVGFISAMYVIFVPIFGLFFKRRVRLKVWVGAVLAAVGMGFLCLSGGIEHIYMGDVASFFCAFGFAAQIITVDLYIDRVDTVKLSMIQFTVSFVISTILAFIFESEATFDMVLKSMPYIIYLGVVACAGGYTLQILGQKYSSNPSTASIMLSFESVFAAFVGAVFLNERFTYREIIGCIVMFAAIIVAQLEVKKKEE